MEELCDACELRKEVDSLNTLIAQLKKDITTLQDRNIKLLSQLQEYEARGSI